MTLPGVNYVQSQNQWTSVHRGNCSGDATLVGAEGAAETGAKDAAETAVEDGVSTAEKDGTWRSLARRCCTIGFNAGRV
eukprot:COSAG02_NODE_86_length_39084_cov_17.815724_16_plen_79_part_00